MDFPWKTYVVYMEGHGIPLTFPVSTQEVQLMQNVYEQWRRKRTDIVLTISICSLYVLRLATMFRFNFPEQRRKDMDQPDQQQQFLVPVEAMESLECDN